MGLNGRTRVLLYVPLLQLGGAERQVGRLARGLDRSRFECIVAWSRSWGPVGDQLVEASIPVCHLPVDSPDKREEAARLIREIQPDIFSSFSYSRNALDVLAADAAGVPLIITCRVNTREWDPKLAIQDWETVRNQRTHWVTAVSEAAANTCAKVEGVPRQKITVIYNGVNVPETRGASPALRRELNLPESVALVGCVANYRPEKGHELLLKAFRRVLDVHPKTHLVCCGLDNRDLKAGLLDLAAELDIDRSVSLLESRTDVDSVYRGLDVYVQPSLFEGFSNALLEAMARGLPVVATGVGGNPEAVLDGVTGLVTKPRDPAAMADAIVALLGDSQRRLAFGGAGYQRCKERFPATAMVDGYVRLYEALRSSAAPARIARGTPATAVPRNDRPVRILFHVDYLWSGGLEKKLGHLALGLDRSRFEPIVSWSRKWGRVGQRLEEAGISVMQIELRPQGDNSAAAEQIRRVEPDIFHSFSCNRHSADVLAARAAGVPIILTNRSNMRHWDSEQIVQGWEKERNQATHKIVANCEAVAALATSVEGIAAEDIAVVLNGVELPDPSLAGADLRDELQLPTSALLVGYAATYRSLKGHESLVRAFREVVDRRPDAHLVCCGEEYDNTRTRLQSLIAELGLERNVSLLACRDDIGTVYRALNVYVHPSLSEGFSNSILEAMAHGLPVVATAVGGTPESVVDGVTGLLVPPGDSAALAGAILTLLDHPTACRKLGEAGLERIKQRFSIAAMVDAFQELYLQVLSGRAQLV